MNKTIVLSLTGQQFGRLTVVERVGNNKWGHSRWLCKCDCGKEIIIRGDSLKSGNTKSCGCLMKKINAEINTRHGHNTRTKITVTYRSWQSIIARCTNPNHKYYHNYGGRGITVCEHWKKFENFLKDMGERPEEHQIDRENNNKGYSPENCHWVTIKQQQRNKRNNRLITYKERTQCLAAWAEETGINKNTLRKRFNLGWMIKEALTTPVRTKKSK